MSDNQQLINQMNGEGLFTAFVIVVILAAAQMMSHIANIQLPE